LEQKAVRIQTTKNTVQEKLSYADQKIAEAKSKLEKEKLDYERDRESLRNRGYSGDRYRDKVDQLKDRLNDDEDDYDEEVAKWQGYKKGLSKSLGELSQNKDIDFNAIENYARDVADYEERKEEARNDARNTFYDKARSGELDETFKKLGLDPAKPSYYGFDKKVEAFNKDVAYKNQLLSWSNKVGFDKISPQAQAVLNPEAVKWQKENPTEKLQFDKFGNVAGIESGKLQQSISIGNYDQAIANQKQIASPKSFKDVFPPVPNVDDFFKGKVSTPSYTPPPAPNGSWSYNSNLKMYQASPYGDGQGTAFLRPPTPKEQKSIDLANEKGVRVEDFTWGNVKRGYKWVDDRVHWDLVGGGMTPTATLTFGKRDEQTIVEDMFDEGVAGIGRAKTRTEEKVIGKDVIEKFNTDLETKYQGIYQEEFDKKYADDLISGDVDFDYASNEFSKSETAKIIQMRYQREYETGYKKLQTDVDYWGGTWGGVKNVGYGLGELGLKTLKSPTRTVVTAGALFTGTKVLGAVPKVITYTGQGALGVYGTYKFIDPESTYLERGAGLTTAVISFGTLGYAGYKYLKQPKLLDRVAIKPPKSDLKATTTIGKDLKIIKDQGEINKVIVKTQKLSQVTKAGSRQPVTTQWRYLSNKYLGTNLKNIYEGVPTAQLGKATTYTSIRGSYTVREPSAYQNTKKLLMKYGYTNAQATGVLRYSAPRVYNIATTQELTIMGGKAVGTSVTQISKPVIDVDKTLGIKTRGGQTITDITQVERQLTATKGLTQTNVLRGSGVLNKAGTDWKSIKELEYTSFKDLTFSSKPSTTYEYLGKDPKGLDVWKQDATYKKLFTISKQDPFSFKFTKKGLTATYDTRVNKFTTQETVLFDDVLDLRTNKGGVRFTGTKTPLSKTFGSTTDDLINKIIEKQVPKATATATGSKTTNINKVIDKIDDFSGSPAQSQYYGTGQYERSEVFGAMPKGYNEAVLGAVPKDYTQALLKDQLKVLIQPQPLTIPDAKIFTGVKDFKYLTQVKYLQLGLIGSQVKSKSDLKLDMKFKQDMRMKLGLKELLKEDLALKIKEAQAIKQPQTSRTSLQSSLALDTAFVPNLAPPRIKIPRVPEFTGNFRPKSFAIPSFDVKKNPKGKKRKAGFGFDQAYLPDFTSRALGLQAESVTEKQA